MLNPYGEPRRGNPSRIANPLAGDEPFGLTTILPSMPGPIPNMSAPFGAWIVKGPLSDQLTVIDR